MFFHEKEGYFSLENVKCKDLYFLSICWNDAPKVNLHMEN